MVNVSFVIGVAVTAAVWSATMAPGLDSVNGA
jgi:hypothetical protein